MPEKNLDIVSCLKSMLPYLTTILLSMWGGSVHYLQKIKKQSLKFKWGELWFDLVISSFAGVLTYFLCQWGNITGPKSAFLIAISGHMGTRVIASFTVLHERLLRKVGE